MESNLSQFLVQLNEISEAVLHATEASSLQEVLDRIASVARLLAGTKYAALGVPDGTGGLRYFRTAGLTDDQIAIIDHVPRGHGLLGAIMSERRLIRLDDISKDHRSSGFPANHPPMMSFLGVPIQTAQQLFGMLYLCDKQDGAQFTEFDELLIQTMASYAALAISSAEAATQAKQLQLLQERERIGMALHDGVIQSLYGLGIQVQVMSDEDTIRGEQLGIVVESLSQIIEDIRGFIMQLRFKHGTALTLDVALKAVAERVFASMATKIQVKAPQAEIALEETALESVLLIVNEALSNAIRHAKATEFSLEGEIRGNLLIIAIRDNGQGFDPLNLPVSDTGGLGIPNMRWRMEALGGKLEIVSGTHGTLVRLVITCNPSRK